MSDTQTNAARLREINDSIRYTTWSVFRLDRGGLTLIEVAPGIDPEAVLNGTQDTKWVVPPLRYWIVRLNLAF